MIDVNQASDARIHNFFLGGTDHYAADHQAVRRLTGLVPDADQLARISRQFLTRAVRYLAGERGIGQFFEHGVGLPVQESVDRIARRVNRGARVVYVDNDPQVLGHARMMLDANHTLIVDADMLDSAGILGAAEDAGLLDRREPVALLFASALHCVGDEREPGRHLRDLFRSLPSGSCLVVSHLASDDSEFRREVGGLMETLTGAPWTMRSFAQVEAFFDGLQPLAGQVGDVARWRAGLSAELRPPGWPWLMYGGVARKP